MNLQNILATIGIVFFVISMVRGCGGIMPGGCGMRSRGSNQHRPHDQPGDAEVE